MALKNIKLSKMGEILSLLELPKTNSIIQVSSPG